jgi:hypothetical protein
MSRVLRRPMFRGGIADSDGVGITSGLDTPKRGLVDGPGGYAGELSFGERFRMAMEQDNANKQAKYDALKSDKSYDLANLFKASSTIVKVSKQKVRSIIFSAGSSLSFLSLFCIFILCYKINF